MEQMYLKTKGEIQTQKAKAKKHFIALCNSQVRYEDFTGYLVCQRFKGIPLFFEKVEDLIQQYHEISPDFKECPYDIFVFECSLNGVLVKFIC